MTTILARDISINAAVAATILLTGTSMAVQAQTATAALHDSIATAITSPYPAPPVTPLASAQAELESLRQFHPHPVVLPLHPHAPREEQVHSKNDRVYVSLIRQSERDRASVGG